MSMTLPQKEQLARQEQARRILNARIMATRTLINKCKTDDERYAAIRDSVHHDMIWRMTHGPQQA